MRAQVIPQNKRLSDIPVPLTKGDIIVKDSVVASNMMENYCMFTDPPPHSTLPKEAWTAYGKMDRTKLPEPVVVPRPKYLGKNDYEMFLDWVVDCYNNDMIPDKEQWLVPKSKEFNGIRFPALGFHMAKNLAAARRACPACQPPPRTVHTCD